MEFEEKEERELDLLVLIDDFLKEARRHLLLALVLVALGTGLMTGRGYLSYDPVYTAHASFTVRVANPLYGSVSSYNSATASQMAATFPHIMTSGVLQERVMSHLGISRMPTVSVTSSDSTSIITIRVTDSDPQRAYDVLNAVITYYPEIAEFVVGSTKLLLLDESGVPGVPDNVFSPMATVRKGVILGGLVWAAIMAMMVLTKNTIHNEQELSRLLNVPCLGHIPAVSVPRKQGYPLINRLKKQGGFSESVRLLRMRVEKSMEEQNAKVLLVSSAIPGEGKSTVSSNLALSLAKKGKRVVLIDCDLRNPSVAKVLHLSAGVSMPDYLIGKANVQEILTRTEQENLYVISGGTGKRGGALDMLTRERAVCMIQAARNLFDYVILDTPPCSLLADAAEIASMADCALMVIRHDYASRDQILDGVQRLGDSDLPLVGCAINGVRKSLASGHGSYGYGGYGYGGYGYGGYGYGSRK